jgi:hypothetical protein
MKETEFTHQELTLLLFALDGGAARAASFSESPSCEESCPVVEELDDLFGGGALPPEKRLARHLSNHLREGLIECGMFELIGARGTAGSQQLSSEDRAKMQRANERLRVWQCEIKLDAADLGLLRESLASLPRSAWIAMPRTMWRLRKKLKAR